MKHFPFFNLGALCKPMMASLQKQGALLLFLLFVCSSNSYAIHIWTGAFNNDWNNAGNWNPASVPTILDFVVIPNVTNDPEIKTGDAFKVSGVEIKIDASLKLNINSQLDIEGSNGDGMLIEGALENFGTIYIGSTNGINGKGIYNKGTLMNRQTGLIEIDYCTGMGIHCVDSEIDNYGQILIGAFSTISDFGVYTINSTFSNYGNALFTIDGISASAYWNGPQSNVRNFGQITIGSKTNIGTNGIVNNGAFNNYDTGKIQIDRVSVNSILNVSTDPFTNLGKIQIGSIGSSGTYGINNLTQFNHLKGEISIDRVRSGIHNDISGTFNNVAILKIGSIGSLDNYGITNGGMFENSANGLVTIDRVIGYGIETHVGIAESFTNQGAIIIGGDAPLLEMGIYNVASFINKPGAFIHINHCTFAALTNNTSPAVPFENEGKILIGQVATAGQYGIRNGGGFINQDNGVIKIDRASVTGLRNYGLGRYQNEGSLIIGEVSSTGTYGIHNLAGAIYLNEGLLTIDRATEIGFYNESGQMENSNDMVIRGTSGNFSIKNLGICTNSDCSKMVVQGVVWNDGQWSNYGILSVNTTEAHTNIVGQGKYMENFGVIEYPKGSPIPNVINHDLISIPVSDNCNSITPALIFGDGLRFTVGNTWYSSSALNTPVGTYNQATNTFIATALAAQLYFPVHDDVNNCDYVVSMKATYQMDLIPPTVICKNATAELNAVGTAIVNPAQVFQSGTDNCGVVAPASVTPSTFNCGKLGANTVTLTANDGNGNNATCVATVTVVDNLAPVLVCKPYTANLNTAGTVSITTANVLQSATDNCGVANLQSVSPNTFTCANLGSQLVTLTGNDGHGNTGTCQATVTVADNVAPTMLCKPVTIALNAAGQASLTAEQVNNGSYDNCGIIATVVDKANFDCSNIGVNYVSLGGIDQSSNKGQCVAEVTVIDPIKPVALCKNATANLGADGTLILAGSVINNGSSDNCSFTLSTSPSSFNCANVGLNTVTLKVTDTGGNLTSCTAKVTIKDVTAPLALCKNTTIYLNDVGQATLSAAQINNGSSDACGIASMNLSKTAFNCSDIPGSAQTVILTLQDVNNNTSTCSAQVTTKDNIVPTAVCANTSVQLGSNGMVTVYSANLAGDSYDNCSVYAYSPVARVYTSANLGINNLNITVKDWSNNGTTCVSVVQVLPYSHLKISGEDRDGMLETENPAFNLYPNPSSGAGILRFEFAKAQDFTVILYDLSGRILWSDQGTGTKGANTLSIDANHLLSGMYIVDFQSENLKKQIRWAIQN